MNNKKYLLIYENLKKQIVDHTYNFGQKLPSKRVTADDYNVSLVTVEHAYELLLEEDYIRSREKSGYFVSYRDGNFFPGTGPEASPEAADYFLSENDTFSFDLYAKTVRKVLSVYQNEIMQRSPFGGAPILKKALALYLKRCRNIKAESCQIIIGSGAEYLYGLLTQFLGKDLIYGIEAPSYQKIQQIYESNGIIPQLLPLGKDGIKSDALWKSQARVLHITPYRSFPTGISASASKKREYIKWAIAKDALLLEDDFESEFTPSRKTAETLYSLNAEMLNTQANTSGSYPDVADSERVIYINTFSRTFSPSIRIAYMVIPYRLLKDFNDKLGFYACSVPTLEQYVLASLIDSGNFERHINRMRRRLRDV